MFQRQSASKTLISAAPEKMVRHASPWSLVQNVWRYRELIVLMIQREIISRYRGSIVGVFWSGLTPLVTLLIYSFVFLVVFKAQWEPTPDSFSGSYPLILFCGLIAFSVFSECVTRAPGLIVANAQYVRKIVFPLEALVLGVAGSAVFHAVISLVILLGATLVFTHHFAWTAIYLPLAFIPLICLSLGISWFLASLGVFIRDLGQSIGLIVQLLFFLTPIVYPLSAVPESFRPWLRLNPLTEIVGEFRQLLLWEGTPDWAAWGVLTLISWLVMQGGYVWFMKSKRAFTDVL